VRVDAHAALRAAERKRHDRALPRHPHRERHDLTEVDVEVVADAALGRTHREQVLHAVAEDGVDGLVVVAAEREGDDEGALWRTQPLPDVVVEAHALGGLVELRRRQPIHGRIPLERFPGHGKQASNSGLVPTLAARPREARACGVARVAPARYLSRLSTLASITLRRSE
jgi:hypothetical protein